jgi:hypothetical protein
LHSWNLESRRHCSVFSGERVLGHPVCLIGASPDGLVDNGNDSGLIEIKCPYVPKNLRPTDIDKLSRQVDNNDLMN